MNNFVPGKTRSSTLMLQACMYVDDKLWRVWMVISTSCKVGGPCCRSQAVTQARQGTREPFSRAFSHWQSHWQSHRRCELESMSAWARCIMTSPCGTQADNLRHVHEDPRPPFLKTTTTEKRTIRAARPLRSLSLLRLARTLCGSHWASATWHCIARADVKLPHQPSRSLRWTS